MNGPEDWYPAAESEDYAHYSSDPREQLLEDDEYTADPDADYGRMVGIKSTGEL